MYPSCFFCRQLREQSKKLVGVKRNQQLEREKQAQLLNEVKKQEDQKDETADFYQVKHSRAFTVACSFRGTCSLSDKGTAHVHSLRLLS